MEIEINKANSEQIEKAKEKIEKHCRIRAKRNNAGGLILYSTKQGVFDIEFIRHVGKDIANDLGIFISGLRQSENHIEIWFNELPRDNKLAELLIEFINNNNCQTDNAKLCEILEEAGYNVEIDRQYKLRNS